MPKKVVKQNTIPKLDDFIFIHVDDGMHIKIATRDILWFEADGNSTYLTTINTQYHIKTPIGTINDKLSMPFLIRIHQSYIVNVQNIESMNYSKVFFHGGKEIPIGRIYRADFKSVLILI